MYMYEPGEVANTIAPLSPGLSAALLLPAVGTIVLGVLPDVVLDFAQRSATLSH
jgi:NADH:ubiquinone oxidoreductase subunit 2 (subunit N)